MMDKRLTHQRVYQDHIRPRVVNRLDLWLGSLDVLVDRLEQALTSDNVAQCVLRLAACVVVIIAIAACIVAVNTY